MFPVLVLSSILLQTRQKIWTSLVLLPENTVDGFHTWMKAWTILPSSINCLVSIVALLERHFPIRSSTSTPFLASSAEKSSYLASGHAMFATALFVTNAWTAKTQKGTCKGSVGRHQANKRTRMTSIWETESWIQGGRVWPIIARKGPRMIVICCLQVMPKRMVSRMVSSNPRIVQKWRSWHFRKDLDLS